MIIIDRVFTAWYPSYATMPLQLKHAADGSMTVIDSQVFWFLMQKQQIS
jgi:hypothetical protein